MPNRPLLAITLLALAPLAATVPASAARAQQPAAPPAPSVKVGQAAPDFSLQYLAKTPDGKYEEKRISLADFKGKKTVILAFFPAAFSPG